MPVDISVKNFQILDDVDLEVDGIACIVGETDQGKSSLIRSLDYVLSNKSGGDFVQDGEDAAEVEVEPDNSPAVKWKKPRDGGATYWLDDDEFDTVGRGRPDFLESINFHPLEAGPDEFDLNFWRQLESFLLVGQPNTRKFELLSKLFEGDAFSDVLSELKSDKKELDDDVSAKDELLKDKKSQLEEKSSQRNQLESFQENFSPEVESVVEKRDRLKTILSLKESYENTRDALESLPSRSFIDQFTEKFETSVKSSDSLFNDLRNKKDLLIQYERVEDSLSSLERKKLELETVIDELDSVDEDEFDRFETISDLKNQYDLAVESKDRLEKKASVLGPLLDRLDSASSIWDDLSQKFDLLKEFKDLSSSLNDLKSRLSDQKSQIENVESEIQFVEDELGLCPLCGQSF